MSAVEVLPRATIEADRLMRQQGAIGKFVLAAWADLVVVDGDPTQNLSMLADPKRGPLLVMKARCDYRDTLQPA